MPKQKDKQLSDNQVEIMTIISWKFRLIRKIKGNGKKPARSTFMLMMLIVDGEDDG